jgi:hypothetical protein
VAIARPISYLQLAGEIAANWNEGFEHRIPGKIMPRNAPLFHSRNLGTGMRCTSLSENISRNPSTLLRKRNFVALSPQANIPIERPPLADEI